MWFSFQILEIEVPTLTEGEETEVSPEYEFPPRPNLGATAKSDSQEGDTKRGSLESNFPLKVRGGLQKKPPGFQAQLACLTPSANGSQPSVITALSINSSYGL